MSERTCEYVLRRLIVGWRCRTTALDEQMVVLRIDVDRDPRAIGKPLLPDRQVIGNGYLIVPATVKDEDGLRNCSRRCRGDVGAEVEEVRRISATE